MMELEDVRKEAHEALERAIFRRGVEGNDGDDAVERDLDLARTAALVIIANALEKIASKP